MQNYNFDEIVPRRHTNSYKWDTPTADNVLPMWVADMDFRTAPCVIDALRRRVEHGIFGYTKVPPEYYSAVTEWFARHHDWVIDPDNIIYTSGVVPALSAVIKALTHPGDKVIVMTPAYNCFFSSIRNNGCVLSASKLTLHDDGSYSIDFEDIQRRASDPSARLLILCNPHNPGGRVWTREELLRIDSICNANNITVISDEIHCELTYEGYRFTPFATVKSEHPCSRVILNSPSKAFNIAGLQIANIISSDKDMLSRIDRAINDNEVCDVNPFGVAALMAAYNEGRHWLDALRDYLWHNYCVARDYLNSRLPQFTVTPLESTYLLWLDCRSLGLSSDEIADRLTRQGHVMVSPGTIYGPGGEGFIRINLACPRSLLIEGLERITRTLEELLK